MTAHDLATGTSWAVIDRPYNSDASRLFLSMSAHSKFLEVRRSVFRLSSGQYEHDQTTSLHLRAGIVGTIPQGRIYGTAVGPLCSGTGRSSGRASVFTTP